MNKQFANRVILAILYGKVLIPEPEYFPMAFISSLFLLLVGFPVMDWLEKRYLLKKKETGHEG